MTEPWQRTAIEIGTGIRERTLDPEGLADALLRRSSTVEPQLQVWAALDPEQVRASMASLSNEVRAGIVYGPLSGVPVGVKDIIAVAGMPTRAGSAWYHETPGEDATIVGRLRTAGALILGKTHTTEFAYADPAPTRNPWNREHTPAGSSSGSAAGVAAGLMPAALGTQTAGSVLRPAAFCGIVGFKPTYGRLSRHGILPLAWTLDHPGTLTRTVADAALLFAVMAGHDPRDPSSSRRPVPDVLAGLGQTTPPRLLLPGEVYPDRLEGEGRRALDEASRRLTDAGVSVTAVAPPVDFNLALDVHHLIMASEAAAVHLPLMRGREDRYRPRLREQVETGALIPAARYLHAQSLRRTLRAAVLPLFDRADALLVPAAAGPAPRGLDWTGDPSFNAPWSLLGLPAIALPAGFSEAGLPLSIQLVAAPWREDILLAAAAWCERVLGKAQVAPVH